MIVEVVVRSLEKSLAGINVLGLPAEAVPSLEIRTIVFLFPQEFCNMAGAIFWVEKFKKICSKIF